MARYLLDTNHLGAALDLASAVHERILQAIRESNKVGTCVPALCELHVGIQQTKHREHNERVLGQLLRKIRLWPMEREIAHRYGEVFHELKKQGKVLSQVDMMLAALCRHMNLKLLTTDTDFRALPDIAAENWLS